MSEDTRPPAIGAGEIECKAPNDREPTLDFELDLLMRAPTVVGVDEVGRGAIAGPVAVGAHVVTVDSGDFPAGLRDSKLLSEKRREVLAPQVDEWGIGSVGYASAHEIDQHGISEMLGEAGFRALRQLHESGVDLSSAIILLDGKYDWLSPVVHDALNVVTRVGADRGCASVAAASVRAKVLRDRYMQELGITYPAYSWKSNKGYGSRAHYEAIAEHGVTPYHRKTWIKRKG
jgi:ribonuclease HII